MEAIEGVEYGLETALELGVEDGPMRLLAIEAEARSGRCPCALRHHEVARRLTIRSAGAAAAASGAIPGGRRDDGRIVPRERPKLVLRQLQVDPYGIVVTVSEADLSGTDADGVAS